jgi:hypothetical protein
VNFAKALRCFMCRVRHMKHWPNLAHYAKVDCGHIDRKAIERCFQPTKGGLRNHLFIDHPSAGWRSAAIYSVVGTCRLIGVNPAAYIRRMLPKFAAATNKTVDDPLPHDFARLYGQSVTER